MRPNLRGLTAVIAMAAFVSGCSVIEFETRADDVFKEQAESIRKQAKSAVKKPVLEARKEAEAVFEVKQDEKTLRPRQSARKERQQARTDKQAPVKENLIKESLVSEAPALPPELDVKDRDEPQGLFGAMVYRGFKTGMYLFTWSGLIKDERSR